MNSSLTGSDYERALEYARIIHAAQRRKGTDIPYITHPEAVAELVLGHGGSEEEAIGALLHDAAEDQGGRLRLDDIRERFGERVATIVEGCTDWIMEPDKTEKDKLDWRPRKEAYISHIADETDESILLVSLADKVHNAGAIVADLETHGPDMMERFNAGAQDVLWYYRSLAEVFRTRGNPQLLADLQRLVVEMERSLNNG
jgi:(p)ppGpp synthase/HD superfamily hydrolase